MLTIQALRRSRGITLTDLALLSGIPARTIASIECGIQRLDQRTREQLAHIFGVPPESLQPGPPPALQESLRRRALAEARLLMPVAGAALASAIALAPLVDALTREASPAARSSPASARPTPELLAAAARAPGSTAPAARPALGLLADVSPTELLSALPTAAPAVSPVPLDGELLTAGGPKVAPGADGTPARCPIAASGQIVLTQGYGVGTHAPASRWGALDLGVDGDGDGRAEPAATFGALVVATHTGVAQVVLNSWPGGNYVRLTHSDSGWATAYAHLDQVFVTNGQAVEAGAPIGTVGSTGYATGPHLHYEVWRNGVNLDPTPFLQC